MSDTPSGNPVEVFKVFLKLGLTSFGGPVAHLEYFRAELVGKRKWVSESQFSQLLAICQFLPGPASSQLGFSLGLLRAGWLGGLAAFLAFTLPSVLLLMAFASCLPLLQSNLGQAAVQGLKIVALAVVAHGVLSMLGKLCPDPVRKTMAGVTAACLILFGTALMQLGLVVLSGVVGMFLCKTVQSTSDSQVRVHYSSRTGMVLVAFFFGLLCCSWFVVEGESWASAASAYYRAGALVFGGGHVVLPLLEEFVVAPGWITQEHFLVGYGAAQAVPGPMFSFASYLGMVQGGVAYGLLAVMAIFLPGFLLLGGILPLWKRLAGGQQSARFIAGINAAVVGLLAAALYDPIFISCVQSPMDLAIGLVGFVLLRIWSLPAIWVVCWCVLASVAGWLLGY
jgi:chromate transporter